MARDDGGVASFFRQEAEHQPSRVAEPAPSPTFQPLTIKRSPSRDAFRNRFGSGGRDFASTDPRERAGGAKSAEPRPSLSIFEDRTLRRGDVVMLKQGLRVFVGSRQFPYTPDDFVALDEAPGLNKQTRTALSEITRNQAPH